MQVKLLRVLQEREIERVGGNRTIKNRCPGGGRDQPAFGRAAPEEPVPGGPLLPAQRVPLHLPPLRERKSDILLLADHFIEKYNKRSHKSVKRIATSAINLLMSYHWPGNVRELENVVERAVLLANNDVILGSICRRAFRAPSPPEPAPTATCRKPWTASSANSSSTP